MAAKTWPLAVNSGWAGTMGRLGRRLWPSNRGVWPPTLAPGVDSGRSYHVKFSSPQSYDGSTQPRMEIFPAGSAIRKPETAAGHLAGNLSENKNRSKHLLERVVVDVA